jgi:hypothetical protein
MTRKCRAPTKTTVWLTASQIPTEDRNDHDQAPILNPLPSEGEELTWKPSPQCASGLHRFDPEHYAVEFKPGRAAKLVQRPEEGYPGGGRTEWSIDVQGDMILKRVTEDHPAGFTVEVLANSDKLAVDAEWNSEEQSLVLTVPRVFEWHDRLRPCIQMRVTVSVPEDAELEQFQLMSVHLDVRADADLHLKASKAILLETVAGDVRIATGSKLDCRSISVHTVSGDVQGPFPLYDNLDIATASGDVDCTVKPYPADDKDPQKANLQVGSMSGDIRIVEPTDEEVPARNYVVDLETYSGDVDATVAASSKLILDTHSGTITAKILPVLDPSLHNCGSPAYSISTYSGSQKISVRDPLWATEFGILREARIHKEPVLDCLSSVHTAISGDVDVRYPATWSGNFAAQSVTGSLKVSGKDVVVDSQSNRPGMNSLKGHHLDGASALAVELVTGDVRILIGEEK